jgi:hypothetical protein
MRSSSLSRAGRAFFFCFLISGRSPMMTQRELNRAVAQATGETVDVIDQMGFSPLAEAPDDFCPQMTDGDDADEQAARRIYRDRSRGRADSSRCAS